MKKLILILILFLTFALIGNCVTELDYMEYVNNSAAQAAYVSSDSAYSIDLCTAGTATADSEYGAGFEASEAFDNLMVGNDDYWQTANEAMPDWLKYDFGVGNTETITQYRLFAPDLATDIYNLKNWTFQGSNNDADWDTLDTQTNVVWVQDTWYAYPISNSTAYRYYKLVITANFGANNYGLVQEMEMMGTVLQCYSEDVILEQGTYSLKGVASITSSLNETLTHTVDPTIDLTDLTQIKYDIRAGRTGSHIKIGIHDSGGTTTEHTANIAFVDTWQNETWDISGVANVNKDAIDSIIITITNADVANTFYIDNMYAEAVAVEVNVILFGTNF